LMQGVKRGAFSAEDLYRREQLALTSLRRFDADKATLDETLETVMNYHQFLVRGSSISGQEQDKMLAKTSVLVRRTLEDRPWKQCVCDICRNIGVEVIIFRSSNRNKRRGFHNLGVFHRHLRKTMEAHT